MNGMVERMARAIDPERWAAIDSMTPSDSARSILIAAEAMRARAAIEAMREPMDAQADATDNLDIYWFYSADGRRGGPKDVWRCMIDAMLEMNPKEREP